MVTALAEENLKNRARESDSSGRESAELDLRLSRSGKVPLANILVLNLVARYASYFLAQLCLLTRTLRSLRGLPISLRTRRQLNKLPPAALKLMQVKHDLRLGLLKPFRILR